MSEGLSTALRDPRAAFGEERSITGHYQCRGCSRGSRFAVHLKGWCSRCRLLCVSGAMVVGQVALRRAGPLVQVALRPRG